MTFKEEYDKATDQIRSGGETTEQDLIEPIEMALEMAKAGKLSGVLMIAVAKDTEPNGTGFSGYASLKGEGNMQRLHERLHDVFDRFHADTAPRRVPDPGVQVMSMDDFLHMLSGGEEPKKH